MENLMSMESFGAQKTSPQEGTQENSKIETVLKDSNSKLCKSDKSISPERPAKVAQASAARMFAPPFRREVYDLFLSSIKYGEVAYPLSKELKKLGFYTSKGITHRRKFRKLLPRFDVVPVNGALVFSTDLETDVLVHKRTGKIIVPSDVVEKVIRRAHLLGNNESNEETLDEATCYKHCGLSRTVMILGQYFSTGRREFGINQVLVRNFIVNCACCTLASLDELGDTPKRVKCRPKCKYLRGKSRKKKAVSSGCELQTVALVLNSTGEVASSQCNNGDSERIPAATDRFSSMVAHIPDKDCIWYDRKSIADTTDTFTKLIMVLGEMRGEMGLAVKGNLQAKQRLEAKLYCAQLLIKDHATSLQKSLILEECPREFLTQLSTLKEEYNVSGQAANIFTSEVEDLLKHFKTHKLVMSPLIVKETEEYVRNFQAETPHGSRELCTSKL